MPTPASWTKEAAKILDRENRRMTEPEPRQPTTAAGLCDKIRFMDGKRCTRPLGHKGKHYIPYPMRRGPAIEAEAADQSGLRAALWGVRNTEAGETEAGCWCDPHWLRIRKHPMAHRFYCEDARAAIAAVERSATSAEPAGEPDAAARGGAWLRGYSAGRAEERERARARPPVAAAAGESRMKCNWCGNWLQDGYCLKFGCGAARQPVAGPDAGSQEPLDAVFDDADRLAEEAHNADPEAGDE